MGRTYQCLTLEQRKIIADMISSGASAKMISEKIGCHIASVYREIERGKNEDGVYDPYYAESVRKEKKLIGKPTPLLETEKDLANEIADFLIAGEKRVQIRFLFAFRSRKRPGYRLIFHAKRFQVTPTFTEQHLFILERYGRRVNRHRRPLHTLHHFRISGYNRTIITVLLTRFFPLIDDERHKDTVYLLSYEVLYMAMH